MFNPLDIDELTKLVGNVPRIPIAVVVRPDIYERLKAVENFKARNIVIGLKVFKDPAADSVAMAQTEECMLFYDNNALTLYLERVEKPMEWVKYCCEQAGIPFEIPDLNESIRPNIPWQNSCGPKRCRR